jgi:hypothetical protein
MKIQKTEFKAIIKECLKELINEGALNQIVAGVLSEQPSQQLLPVNPIIKAAAIQTAGGNPQQTALMEQIFADTAANSLPHHMRNEVPGLMGANFASLQENMIAPPPSGYLPQRNPLPPKQAAIQQAPATAASRWANLAFNSPISNRPTNGSGAGPTGFLPGAKKGSFE